MWPGGVTGSLGFWWLHAPVAALEREATGDCSAEDQAGELGGVGLALEAGWGWEPKQMRLCHLPAKHQVPGELLLKSRG